jgi:hypothetical protein
VRNPDKRQRFGEAARRYALTRGWEAALEPLYRSYAAVPEAPVAQPIAAHAMHTL